MQLCSYAVMQLCSYAVMQLCSYAVMQLCSYAVMQLCNYARVKTTMRELLSQLEALEGVNQRTLISVIRDLNKPIRRAQDSGYKVAAIHLEVSKTVDIDLASFKTLLYRVRRVDQTKSKTEPLAKQKPDISTIAKEVIPKKSVLEFDKDTAAQRSKHKLAQFGKGK